MANFTGSYPPPQPAGNDLWAEGREGTWAYLDKPVGPGITPELYEKRQALKLLILQNRQDQKDASRMEKLDKAANLATARAIAEGAFQGMVSSCVNRGQVDQLMSIKDEWIEDAAAGPVRSFSDYMRKWSGRVG